MKFGASFEAKEAPAFIDILINIIPTNPFKAMVDGNMLQIISFSVLIGFGLSRLGEKVDAVFKVVEQANEILMYLVQAVMKLAPYGAFALIAMAIGGQGVTAIMQGVATVFIAQVYGVDLVLQDLITVVLSATLASVGTAGVPGVGLIMLSMVLNFVGLPVEGIALILGVDRILDMTRTAVNITGDAACTVIIAKTEEAR